MNLLAIDTSGDVGSVCIANEEKIFSSMSINYKKSHSIMLMPMIDNILKMVNMSIKDIDYFVATKGPGSFTGLRIGASTVKAMAHTLNKKIITVSTLEALAYNIFTLDRHIVPMIDARGERVYSGIYKHTGDNLLCIKNEEQINISSLLQYIDENGILPIFLGDGANVYKDIILEKFSKNTIAPMHLAMQTATSLASLAFSYIAEKKYIDYNDFFVDYLRKPQAQRELEEREKNIAKREDTNN